MGKPGSLPGIKSKPNLLDVRPSGRSGRRCKLSGKSALRFPNPQQEVFMARKLSLLAGLVFLVSLTAQAQDGSDKVELFGGYSTSGRTCRPAM
jgi:hypothetical protein